MGWWALAPPNAREALFGLVSSARGTFRMDGHPIHLNSPAQAVANHIAYVPPDRHRQGIIRQLSIRFNLTLAVVRRLCRRGFVRRQAEQALVDEYIKAAHQVRRRCTKGYIPLRRKSAEGGYCKVAGHKPSLLILNDPTRGVDVGAKAEIYALISELACAGMAIIITSSEISEILGMSDRILVLNEGRRLARISARAGRPEITFKRGACSRRRTTGRVVR